MEEFDTLDSDLSVNETEIPGKVKQLAREIAPWIKLVALVNLGIQVINLLISFAYGLGGFEPSSFISVAISVALYVTLLNWGTAMDRFSKEGSIRSFSDAMKKQKNYWMFLGIILIIALVVFLIVLIIAINDPHILQDFIREVT
ncbi:MAG: hypothetical protein MI810_05545 [Flavobacteriales bacterium]|nr:hypothetical protein [Flavobacteriales bacterium]